MQRLARLPTFLPLPLVTLPRNKHHRRHRRFLTMSSIPCLPLGQPQSPSKMPVVGLGTWKSASGVTATVVHSALKAGYRCIDCACDYGNEAEVGAGITSAMAEGIVKREDLFVTSKLWNTFHRREHVRPALMRSLSDLQLSYLDLYLIHFPISLKYVPIEKRYPPEWVPDPNVPGEDKLVEDRVPIAETWAAMEALVDEGLVKHIGVCNFSVSLLMDFLSYARIRPAVLQVELHPYLQQNRLVEFCKREGIAVTGFSPLGSGSYIQLDMDRGDRLLEDAVLKEIARRKGKTAAQVVLRWGVQRGTAVIPKTERKERLMENFDIFDFELSNEEMDAIQALDRGTRYNDPAEFCIGMGKSVPIYD